MTRSPAEATASPSPRLPPRDAAALAQSEAGDIRIGPILAIPQVLQALHARPQTAFDRAGVPLALFQDPDTRLPLEVAGRLFAECALLTDCPHFALLVGERFSLDGLGPLGELMRHSPTVGAALRSLLPQAQSDLARLMRRVNSLLLDATASQHYVTLFLGIYEEGQRTLRYVNCGHLPPILLRATGEAARLVPTAPVVGLLEEFRAHEEATVLGAGDTLLVYSDGVSETVGRAGDELGAERLLAVLKENGGADSESLVARLLEARRAFAAGAERDDVTVLVAQGC